MKNKLLALVCGVCAFCTIANAQTRDRYTPSFGILGGANYSHFRFTDKLINISDDWRWGWAAGVNMNFPITNTFSIEPQALFSRMGSKYDIVHSAIVTSYDQRLDYVSVPVLFKFNMGRNFNIFLGPQVDFLIGAKDMNYEVENKDAFKSTDVAGTAGFELFPRSRVTFYARYIRGFMNVADNEDNEAKIYNEGVQAGLKIRLFGGKHKSGIVTPPPPPPAPVVVDTDGDGVPDDQDKCPTVAGLAKYNGCPIPDTDGDGVNDEEDKCPTVAGIAKYHGCPIPDTDGDGINDEEDKCPTVAGVAKYHGCPIPDTDGDGLNDEEDRCPTVAGPKDNFGCPVIKKEVKAKVEKAAKNIFFQTGKSTLLAKSFASLDGVVSVMKEDASLNIDVKGHTDNTGKAELNQTLSQQRADAVKAYLVKKGIDESRITSNGYGDTQPIATNATAAGRQQNRRVEMVIRNY